MAWAARRRWRPQGTSRGLATLASGAAWRVARAARRRWRPQGTSQGLATMPSGSAAAACNRLLGGAVILSVLLRASPAWPLGAAQLLGLEGWLRLGACQRMRSRAAGKAVAAAFAFRHS